MTKATNDGNKWLAKILAAHGFRNNTPIEGIHAGTWPKNAKGEWADPAEVIVTTVDGGEKIPWDSCSRISDPEMKEMNKAVVDNIYSLMSLLEEFSAFPWTMEVPRNWDEAKHAPWYKVARKDMLKGQNQP
ncbi:hypothetical protein QCM77_39460 [Bradyrhizobium sp. SSUT18]|uniref:hypothetical protein n=1 Tax=unclassified Bradyrhizobium TaxID=2631580 RepID=UPI00244727BD|nr:MULTISPECIES: hypothetical protein [unclassified Bradyrhizobium]MDH2348443.1 hypothetical protein [Bradyrhizobium sp. SSUT77]MDH2356592.1 hypothetical protein [Bradyrhizobium sp. SSUT112]MDH2405931.1 hypothetical protein [Bradyrhizobium sp. SSUT18]